MDGSAVDTLRGDVRDGRRHGHHADDQPRPPQRSDRARRSADRWTLIRRGTLLYAFGFVFDWIWAGTILFFYGAFFVVGALLFTLRTRWLIVDRCARRAGRRGAAVVGVRDEQRHDDGCSSGWYTDTPYRSPRRLLFDTFVNGTHPLLPWLAFLCAGMALGRYLPLRSEWRRVLIALGLVMVAGTYLANHVFADTRAAHAAVRHRPVQPQPQLHDRHARLVDRRVLRDRLDRERDEVERRVTQAFAAAGRMTLTLYIAPRARVQHRRPPLAPDPPDRSRRRAGLRRRVLDRRDRPRRAVAEVLRHRAGRVGLPTVRRQQHAGGARRQRATTAPR